MQPELSYLPPSVELSVIPCLGMPTEALTRGYSRPVSLWISESASVNPLPTKTGTEPPSMILLPSVNGFKLTWPKGT